MACAVLDSDMVIICGNNYPPAQWQFLESENPDVLFDLTGSVFKLAIDWPGGEIQAASDDGSGTLSIDLANSIVTWAYTIEQSRMIPQGRIAEYELERWISGTQQDLITGNTVVSGEGNNPD